MEGYSISNINNTKIKYLKVANKIYKIEKISFFYMTIEAMETDFTTTDVPDDELWDLEELRNYRVKLVNSGGQAEIVEFEKWLNKEDKRRK